MNGNIASLTAKVSGMISYSNPCSASEVPTMQRAAIFASERPIHLETNGTVREARGFTSIT